MVICEKNLICHNQTHFLSCFVAYDEREDFTLQSKGQIEKEAHVTFVGPDGEYINHSTLEYDEVTKKKKSAKNFCKALVKVLEDTNSIDSLQMISSDGCPTNTGREGGANRLLELKLERPLFWVSCF